MPFIWDDVTWKLIDDEEPYDKSRFVVVRKLHIELNTDPWQTLHHSEFTADTIHRRLRMYGEIETIQLLPNKESEAYVTFISDRSAYLLQLQHEFDREARKQQPFYIYPADSWMQPKEAESQVHESGADVQQTSEIFMLNEDCLLHLFKLADLDMLVNLAGVCKLFHTLTHKHCFPRIHHFNVYNFNDTFSMPLAKMHRTLRCIGPYITDLNYTCNIYNDLKRSTRFLEALAQHIGPNLRRAQFKSSLICEENTILIVAPILRHLESLQIHDINYSLENDIDFEEMCPNLNELKLKMNMLLIKCCKPWARLRHLSVINNEFINTMTFIAFIKQNPQLTTLEFDVCDAEIRLRSIANHLPQLQSLTMDSMDSMLAGWHLGHVAQLQHLTEIDLLTLDYQHIRSICDGLATFTGLRKIGLHAYRPDEGDEDNERDDDEWDYERSIIGLAKELPNLEEFSLRSIAILEKTLFDFVRFASQLKVLHIHWCGIFITDALVLQITNILKCKRSHFNQPFMMYINPADFIYLHVRRNDEVKSCMQISSRCKHFGH